MLSILAGFLILVMFLYGGYSLWDTARIYGNAAVGEELLKYKPTSETEGEHLSLQELALINPDTRGWLTIPDTHIDYPVLQGNDDMEYINMCLVSSLCRDPYSCPVVTVLIFPMDTA